MTTRHLRTEELAHTLIEAVEATVRLGRLAGNLSKMLSSLTPANDLRYRRASDSPTLLIEEVTIAGR
jgi:hypothetical protein